MHLLNSHAKTDIAKIQKESLRSAAKRAGRSYRSYLNQAIIGVNRFHIRSDGSYSPLQSGISLPLRTEADYWSYRTQEALDLAALSARLFENAFANGALEVNTTQICELAAKLDDVIQCGTKGLSIREIIQCIPAVHLTNLHFNAVASLKSFELPFPHVRHYYTAQRVLQIMAYSLAGNGLIFCPQRNMLLLRRPDQALYVSERSPILTTLLALFHVANNDLPEWSLDWFPAYKWSIRTAGNQVEILPTAATISVGAKLFVWLHEVAHHVCGHLGSSAQSPHVEEQAADLLAIRCLEAQEDDHRVWQMMMGAEMTLIFTQCLENTSQYHPSGHFRSMIVQSHVHRLFNTFWQVPAYLLLPLHIALDIYFGFSPAASRQSSIESLVREIEAKGLFG